MGSLFVYGLLAGVVLEVLRAGAQATSSRAPKYRWTFFALWLPVAGFGSLIVFAASWLLIFGFLDMPPPGGLPSLFAALATVTWIAHCVRTVRAILGLAPILKFSFSERSRLFVRRYWLRSVIAVVLLGFVVWANLPL